MADQNNIDDLVYQLKELISILGKTSSTPASATSKDQGVDRIVNALGKLNATIKGTTTTRAEEQKSMKRFTADVDRATKAQKDQADQIEKDLKKRKELADQLAEQARLASLSNEDRKKELSDAKKKSDFDTAASSLAQNNRKKENSTWSDLIDTYGRTNSAGTILKERFESIGGTSLGATVGLKLTTAALEGLVEGLSTYGKALYKGEQGATVAAKGVTTFVKSIASAVQAIGGLLLFIPGFQLLGAGLLAAGTAAKGFAEYTEAAAEMSDRLYKSYQDLSKFGVTASDGMIGIADSAKKLGYGIDQIGLEQFGRLMGSASKDLAMMSGSAIQGRKNFAEFAEELTHGDIGRKLMNLGMSVDDINTGAAGFIKQQVSLGRAQTMSNKQLKDGAEAYIKEMDTLTKLTGIQKQQLESQMDSNRRNERFRAAIEKVRLEQGDVAAKNLEYNMAVMSERFPETAEGLKDIAAGYVTTEAARKATLSGLSEIPQLMTKGLGSGTKELGQILGKTSESLQPLAEVGAYGPTFGNFYEAMKARGLSEEDAAKRARELIAERERQEKSEGDKSVDAQSKMRQEQMKSRDELQNFVKAGVAPATTALEKFSETLNKMAGVTKTDAQKANEAAKEKAKAEGKGWWTQQWEGSKAGLQETLGLGGKTAAKPASTPSAPTAPTAPTGGPAAGSEAAAIEQYRNVAGGAALPGKTSPDNRKEAPVGSSLAGTQSSLAEKIIKVESGGRNIGTSTSSAFGVAQFTKGTFKDLVKGAGPNNPLYGKTWEDYKSDVSLQREALNQLMDKNRQTLTNKNLPTTDAAMYLAHFLGAGGASKVLSASDNTDISQVIGSDAIASNPGVFNKVATVGDLKNWADKKMGGTGYTASAAFGGVFAGPKSGYTAMLHGTEAVVPLGADRKMPFDVDGMMNSMNRAFEPQMQAMQIQISRLDELVNLMRRQATAGERMLQFKQA